MGRHYKQVVEKREFHLQLNEDVAIRICRLAKKKDVTPASLIRELILTGMEATGV